MNLLLRTLVGNTTLKKLGEDAAREIASTELRKKWEAHADRIAIKIAKKKTLKAKIRDAQYWLWKAIFRSGFVADAMRDSHDDKIIAAVTPQAPATDLAIVQAVIEAEIDLTF